MGERYGAPIADLSAYRISPGEQLVYTQDFDVMALGDGLIADVTLAPGSITPASGGAADNALASTLLSDASFLVDGNATTTIMPSVGSQTVEVTVVIDWFEGADDNIAAGGTVDLSGFVLAITQQTP